MLHPTPRLFSNGNSSLDPLQPRPGSISINDLFCFNGWPRPLTRQHGVTHSNRGLGIVEYNIRISIFLPHSRNAITPEPLLSTSSGFPLPPSPIFPMRNPSYLLNLLPRFSTLDVISSLLGMTPSASPAPASPSSSTALSSSSSRRSGQYQYRYEGDNEDEASDESDRGFSASESATSTVLDFDADN